jgi:hypothetical protein
MSMNAILTSWFSAYFKWTLVISKLYVCCKKVNIKIMKNCLYLIFLLASFRVIVQDVKTEDLILISEKSIRFKKNRAKIKVRLWNKSKDILKYISMSCSWQEIYLTNSEDLKIKINECDKNIPIIILLKPNENRIVSLEIEAKKEIINEFKIGLKLNQIKNLESQNDEYRLENTKILWSSIIFPYK